MVARVFVPGCQLDNMCVFEGPQGAGKSRAMRAIGGEWHTEVKENVTSNDFFMVLHGRLLVEIAELDSFNRAEITRIKQVVTCPTDRYRAPYARAAQDHKRMSIFAATTNESIYLKDHTGARRFWPIKCGQIKIERIVEQREQLFAEAVARFKRKEGWHEMPPAETAEEQEQRRQADEWESIVTEYLVDKKETTIRDVAGYLKIETAKLDMILQKRIANIMRTVGWEKATKRDSAGHTVRIWREVELPFRDPPAGQGRLGVD
jgi:predicted P-loop ATPase